mgnify:CR=1 FL=1
MTLRALLLCVLLPTAALAGVRTPPAAGTPLGLVLGTSGQVTAGDKAISPGSMLTEGQALRLAADATLVFSLITTCKELTISGPGALKLVGGAAVMEGAKVVSSAASPGCVSADRVALSSASQVRSGAVVVRGGTDGRLSPRGGFVTAHDRTLRWDGPLADGRGVVVLVARGEQADDVLLEVETTGASLELPADLPLVPGGEYAWSVEPSGVNPGPQLAGTFRVAEIAVATQLDTLRGRAADAPGWLRVAFFCEVHLLEGAAADAYARALELDKTAAGAQERLRELDLPG